MRLSRILLLMGACALAAAPVAAQGRGLGKPASVGKPVGVGKTTTAAKGPKTQTTDKSNRGKSADAKSGTLAKGPKSTATDTDTNTVTATSNGRGDLTIAERIEMNPQQKARIEAALDGSGLTLTDAADGFRNQGQFIAAVNAYQNQQGTSFTFADLKAKMTGETPVSLGQALQELGGTSETTETTTTESSPTP